MRFPRIAMVLLLALPVTVWAQNNTPHIFLFNQPVNPFSSSVAEAGILYGRNPDPFISSLAFKTDSGAPSPLKLMAGVAIPTGGNTRINFSATKIFKNRLLIALGYGGENLGYKESTTVDAPNGIKGQAAALNLLYRFQKLTLQAGATQYGFSQDKTIKEKGLYSSFGASYSIADFQIGLQFRGIPLGKGTQTVQYTDIENGQEVPRKESNTIKLPTQIVIPVSYTIVHNEKLSGFIEGNAGFLLANLPANSNKLNLGGMARLTYKPFFVQAGYAASGFTGGNFSEKIGVGVGVDLKDLSLIYSYSTNQVYKNLQVHSIGLALTIGS